VNDTSKMHNAKVNSERGAMNLVKLIEEFADEGKCRTYLEKLRWPQGVRCPRCDGDKVRRIQSKTYYRTGPKKGQERGTRDQYDCSCGYQFSVRVGTVFHDSHLPLWKWFLAAYLMIESKKGMSANQLKHTLDVTYETAWFLCHRIRSAMTEAVPTKLSGIVEADETYVGGKPRNRAHSKREAAQRRMDNKTVVLGAIERGGKLRVQAVADAKQPTIRGFPQDNMADEASAIYTDSHHSYRGTEDDDTRHEYVDHSAEEWVRGDVHTNSIESAWSLFDRAVIGSYHKLSQKHMNAYLDEFEFRFNNRDNPFLFRDTLMRLIEGDPLSFDRLVDAQD
jgi:transposase-like protein